jgi:ligand-binding sensor domain-containing protein
LAIINNGAENMDKINILNSDIENLWKETESGFHETVNALIVDLNQNIFAGTRNGLFVSADQGKNWSHIGLANVFISSIAIDSQGYLFAGSHKHGVYRSIDSGQNWFEMNMGLEDSDINAIVINSQDEIFLGTESGLFRSTNSGMEWQEANNELIYPFIDALTITSDRIFAGTDDGIFVSDIHSENWKQTNLRNTFILSLISNNNDVYTGTREGIFHSADKGETWHNTGLKDKEILSLAFVNEKIMAGTNAGLFYSDDNAKSWKEINDDLSNKEILSIVPGPNGDVFVGTGDGVFGLKF